MSLTCPRGDENVETKKSFCLYKTSNFPARRMKNRVSDYSSIIFFPPKELSRKVSHRFVISKNKNVHSVK